MRGKRGIQQIIIALFVIIALGSVLVLGSSSQSILTKIGDKQTLLLSSYAEAEKARDYYTQIARLGVSDAAKEIGINLDACIMKGGFSEVFTEKVKDYDKGFDISSNPRLTVLLPKVKWYVVSYADWASAYGEPADATDNDLVVNGEDFEYRAGFFVNHTFCESKCGNGLLQGTEECDGGDFGMMGNRCGQSRKNPQGFLKCTPDCKVDYGACVEPECGNGVIEDREVCDDPAFGQKTCSTEAPLGRARICGTLKCTNACGTIDTSGCYAC